LVNAQLAQSQADNATKDQRHEESAKMLALQDKELAELRARLASHGGTAEGVPP